MPFDKTPYIEAAAGWVTVWVGDLTESELEAYVHEPGNPDPEGPISTFSAELGRWYDHHLLWGGAKAEPRPLGDLAEAVGLEPPSLTAEVARRGGASLASCLLVLFDAKPVPPTERMFAKGKLRLFGWWREASPVDY